MKKTLILFTLLLFALAGISNAQVRKEKKYPGLATNIAIVGGSTAAGALIGGRKGAMIGAGAGLLYASSRKGTKRRAYGSNYRRIAKIAGGTLVGAGVGGYLGGKKGMIIGSLIGAGATYLYTKNGYRYYRARNGKIYAVPNW
ncbi:MAG: hypothetical protein N2Z23_08460 [Pyrinomonadaceae bacterium]|nr:hypothetical protein [Pyrinomonadaceae bacterium]MCX7640453.1 hypothetical protein [Pyrinomonadaceae bacterium]MDW8304880.1 hypothetical protein [Acidobacteriota bacterium]